MAELESRGRLTRAEVADFLRQFADELDEVHRRADRDQGAVHDGRQDREDDRFDGGDHDHRDDLLDHGDRNHRETLDDRDGDRHDYDDDLHDRDPGREDDDREYADDPRRVTMVVGGDSATITVPETVDFDVEVTSRSGVFSSDVTQAIDFYLSWEVDEEEEPDDRIEVV